MVFPATTPAPSTSPVPATIEIWHHHDVKGDDYSKFCDLGTSKYAT